MSFLRRLFGRDEAIVHAVETIFEVRGYDRVDETHHRPESPYGDSLDLYKATERLIQAAKFPKDISFAADVALRFINHREERSLPVPHDIILREMVGIIAGIYDWERLSHLPPMEALYAPGVAGHARDYLLSQQVKAENPTKTLDIIAERLVACFDAFSQHLPALAMGGPEQDHVPTLQVVDLIHDVPRAVEDLIDAITRTNALNVLKGVEEKIGENCDKIREERRASRLIAPTDYDGSPREVVAAYLSGTGLDGLFFTEVPFEISLEDRGEHTAIVGGAGHGKTQLLQTIIAADLETEDPPGMVVIDSTGAMVQRIQRLAVFNERLKDRLLIIDPELNPVPALNPFDLSNARFASYDSGDRERIQGEVIDLFNYVFSTINNALTTRMATAFAFMVRLMLSIEGADIHMLLELLDDDPPRGDYEQAKFKPHIDKLDPTTQHFFKVQYYTGKESGLREQIRARVFDILRVPAFERMFSTVNTVDFFTELNKGTIILVNTSENLLKDGSTTFGRYIIARCMAAAFERAPIPPEKRKQVFLIIDEAAQYFDETFEKLLNRARQFKLAGCIAFQNLDQASEKLKSTIASSTAVKYVGGTGYADARWFSREMRTEPEFIIAQKRDSKRPPQWTQFACYVRNFTDRAVSLTIPFFRLENMPQMSPAAHAALLERNKARVSAPTQPAPPPTLQAAEPVAAAEPAVNSLAKAYAELAEAVSSSDWARAAALENTIIPELKQQLRAAQAEPATANRDPPRPAATSPEAPRPAATPSDNVTPPEGTTEWKI